MIIACRQCQTRFQIDAGRIPSGGARVRCSKCQHAFFVRPPEVETETTLGGVVAEAVEAAIPVPEPEAAAGPGETDPSLSSALEPMGEIPPEEWTFNEDPPGSTGGSAARVDQVDLGMEFDPEAPADLFGAPGDLGSSATFRSRSGTSAQSSAPEPHVPAAPPSGPVPEFDLAGDDSEGVELASTPSPAPDRGPTAGAEGSDSAAALNEIGDPKEWDFLADSLRDDSSRDDSLREEALREDSGSRDESHAPEVVAEAPEAPIASAAPQRPRSWFLPERPAEALAWALAVVVTAGGLLQVAQGMGRAPLRPLVAVTLAPGTPLAGQVRARSLENLHEGWILVVEGVLEGGTPGKAVRVRLLDAAGEPLPGATAWAGPALPASRLRQDDPTELRAGLTRGAASLASGGRFHAVFQAVPRQAWAVAFAGEPAPALRATSRPSTPPQPDPLGE